MDRLDFFKTKNQSINKAVNWLNDLNTWYSTDRFYIETKNSVDFIFDFLKKQPRIEYKEGYLVYVASLGITRLISKEQYESILDILGRDYKEVI